MAFGALSSFAPFDLLLMGGHVNEINFLCQTSGKKHAHLSPARRRSVVVIDAHRVGYRSLSEQLADVVDLPALEWSSLWATTDLSDLRAWRDTLNSKPSSVAIGGHSDALLVAVGDRTGLSVTDLDTGEVTVSSASSLGESFRCLVVLC